MQTVEQVLTAATDSVTLINDINSGTYEIPVNMTQEEINEMVQRNVDHLEIILAYTEPDVVGDSSDKTSYTTAMDSVNLINGVNAGTWGVVDMTQEEINDMVQRNVDHLEVILAYTEPDVVGDSSDKSSYTDAIATGNTYITNNS